MTKIEREYRTMCRKEGFDLLGVVRGARHFKLIFECGFVTVSGTPSNRRNLLDARAAVRRAHKH